MVCIQIAIFYSKSISNTLEEVAKYASMNMVAAPPILGAPKNFRTKSLGDQSKKLNLGVEQNLRGDLKLYGGGL